MTARFAAVAGALLAGIGVALGAFGAHALRARLEPRSLEIYETGVRYQMYHAFALLAVAWLLSRNVPAAANAGWAFMLGTLLFSGSLYLMALTGWRWLGPVTPLGGAAFLAGWVLLALAAAKLEA
jgi:uncharacterized membrane protein YgdD (TMEM256/DUF423 family)